MDPYPPDEKYEPSIATGGVNTPSPTPRTDAVWRSGGNILEHAQQLETELDASDLDRNRLWTEAAKAKVKLDEMKDRVATLEHQLAEEVGPHYTLDTVNALAKERDELKAEIARWQAEELQRTSERDELKAELSLTRTNLYAGLDRSVDYISTPHLAAVASNALITARAEIVSLKAEVLDEVEDRARETCHTAPQATDYLGRKAGELVTDSGAISSRADDLWRLHDAGRFRVHTSTGRMVVGYWPENDTDHEE